MFSKIRPLSIKAILSRLLAKTKIYVAHLRATLSDNVVAQCLKIIHLKIAVFNNEKPKFISHFLPSKSLLFNKLWTKKRTQLLPIGKYHLR